VRPHGRLRIGGAPAGRFLAAAVATAALGVVGVLWGGGCAGTADFARAEGPGRRVSSLQAGLASEMGVLRREEAARLLRVALGPPGAERVATTDSLLIRAERLASEGRAAEAERIFQALWNGRTAPEDRHVRCACLRGLAFARGPDAVPMLLDAMTGVEADLRRAALLAAVEAPGEAVTAAWRAACRRLIAEETTSPPVGAVSGPSAAGRGGEAERGGRSASEGRGARLAAVLDVLGRRGGPEAEAAVLEALASTGAGALGPREARAAVEAAGRLGTRRAAEALVALLRTAEGPLAQAARQALVRMPRPGVGDPAAAAAATSLPGAGPRVRRALLEVLVRRGACAYAPTVARCLQGADPETQRAALSALAVLGGEPEALAVLDLLAGSEVDEAVRRSAEAAFVRMVRRGRPERVGPALVARLKGAAGPEARASLIRLASAVPTEGTLSAVRAALGDPAPAVREAARAALCAWPGPEAVEDLARLAAGARDLRTRLRAVHALVRLAAAMPEEQGRAPEVLARVLALAQRDQERRLALGVLGRMASAEALRLALRCLERPGLSREAAAAVVTIAERVTETAPETARRAAERVLAVEHDPGVRERAERLLTRLRWLRGWGRAGRSGP